MDETKDNRRTLAILTFYLTLASGCLQALFSPCFWTKFNEPCPELHAWGWMPVGTALAVCALALVRMSPRLAEDTKSQLLIVASGVIASLALGVVAGFPDVSHPFTSHWRGPDTPPVTKAFWLALVVPFFRTQWFAYLLLFGAGMVAIYDIVQMFGRPGF